MGKIKVQRVACIALVIAICAMLIWNHIYEKNNSQSSDDNGIEQIDGDTSFLKDSKVQVEFFDVILGPQSEERRLIVSTQDATASYELTDGLIKKLDFDFLKKTQKVSYTGTGYFVVDLDKLTKEDIVVDQKNKTITIQIEHSYLRSVEIDPDKIIIDEVKEGLLAKGKIKLTVNDYTIIEDELRTELETKLSTDENKQKADDIALRMVAEIYEPLIKAVDSRYSLGVEFKN